jgi:hypothetical protein
MPPCCARRSYRARSTATALPSSLETAANGLNLGDAAFTTFWPDRLSGDNGPFNPFTEGSRW